MQENVKHQKTPKETDNVWQRSAGRSPIFLMIWSTIKKHREAEKHRSREEEKPIEDSKVRERSIEHILEDSQPLISCWKRPSTVYIHAILAIQQKLLMEYECVLRKMTIKDALYETNVTFEHFNATGAKEVYEH